MANHTIISYDEIKNSISHKLPEDLLSNLQYFRDTVDTKTIEYLKSNHSWSDNSDYSTYRHVDEIIEMYNPDTDLHKSWVCRVPMSYIFTSDKSLPNGYDRCSEIDHGKCVKNLSENNDLGFDDFKSDTLNGHFRWDKKGRLILVKNKGNHRQYMKLLANYGESTEVLMKVRFHEQGLSNSEYIKLEAESQFADSNDRNTQNERQKFFAGYRAGRPEYIECFNFLDSQELDFDGIMFLENKIEKEGQWKSITSLSGLKGMNNGHFKRYGTDNVKYAITVCQKICDITGESDIPNSSMEGIANLFKWLTDRVDVNTKPPFTKEQLKTFFLAYFRSRNKVTGDIFTEVDKLTLRMLAKQSGFKCVSAICIRQFWTALVSYYGVKVRKDGNTHGIGHKSKNVEKLLDSVEPANKSEARSIIFSSCKG